MCSPAKALFYGIPLSRWRSWEQLNMLWLLLTFKCKHTYRCTNLHINILIYGIFIGDQCGELCLHSPYAIGDHFHPYRLSKIGNLLDKLNTKMDHFSRWKIAMADRRATSLEVCYFWAMIHSRAGFSNACSRFNILFDEEKICCTL